MPIRRSPNDARHPGPQAGRDPPEQVVAINRNAWSRSPGARTPASSFTPPNCLARTRNAQDQVLLWSDM